MISKVSYVVFCGMISLAVCQYHDEHHSEPGTSYVSSNLYSGHHTEIGHHDEHYGHHDEPHDYYAYPKYKFDYHVNDHHTGDVKAQAETRHGDTVTGFYTLHEPDGTILEVHYEADKKTGFNAKVHRKGKSYHPEVQKHEHHYH